MEQTIIQIEPFLTNLGALGNVLLAGYWLSIAISQKSGPYSILSKARSFVPILGKSLAVGVVSSILLYSIVAVVPYSWFAVFPLSVAGGAVVAETLIGNIDYKMN